MAKKRIENRDIGRFPFIIRAFEFNGTVGIKRTANGFDRNFYSLFNRMHDACQLSVSAPTILTSKPFFSGDLEIT
jgi:hypothetical protein